MPNLTVDPQPQDNLSSSLGLDPQRGSNPLKAIFIGILIFVLLSATAYGAYWYGQSVMTMKVTSSTPLTTEKVSSFSNVPSPKPVPTPVDETAGWKTYTNKKFSFSFKYPGVSKVNETDKMIDFSDENKNLEFSWMTIDVLSNNTGTIGRDWIESFSPLKVMLKMSIYSSGENKITWTRSGDWYVSSGMLSTFGPQYYGYLFKGTEVYELKAAESEQVFGQILSTFKFL